MHFGPTHCTLWDTFTHRFALRENIYVTSVSVWLYGAARDMWARKIHYAVAECTEDSSGVTSNRVVSAGVSMRKHTGSVERMRENGGVDRHFRSRNDDVRVKHLVTQPGNAPKARPSHLATADEVNKVSEGLTFVDHKDWVLQRMQTLNWDTALVSHPQ